MPAVPSLPTKRDLRTMYAMAEDIAAQKLGYANATELLAAKIAKDDDGYWKGKAIQARLEPKEVSLTAENSAEALLAAIYAQERGEIVVFAEEKIAAVDAHFVEGPIKQTLWSAPVINACA